MLTGYGQHASAQELNAKVVINRSQISNTTEAVFEALQNSLTAFLNERQWTKMTYEDYERINCTFSITLKTYSETDNSFTGSIQVQSVRPVYNSNYSTTVFNIQDENFNFNFQQFDQLDFRPEQVDNNLTAMLAYYAYLIIGMDMDTMAPLGGTDILQMAMDVANNAQNLGYAGWKAFEDSRNRFAIINDYLDGGLEPLRQMEYEYHRLGLDRMTENTDSARSAVTSAIVLLKQAHENKSQSLLPQIITDIKRDEIVSIYSSKGTREEKEQVYDIVFAINASQNPYWEKIKK
ncbi:MAG TPA: DUF4835 family protein [Candidatus Paraprevotella stercorigallinarum]|nr:DUF4835 family protein [Candidatus Paraprevotella stercorigallinarum]